MSNKQLILALLIVSAIIHFAYFGHPSETVFDEVHFGKFVTGYYTHEYFFDIHPPLGKLIVAGFAKIFNFEPEYAFANIGEKYPDKQYLILRFLPSLAGMLLPIVIFLLALQIGFGKTASFFAGMLVSMDNALLVQSRFILMDAFLLLFGFSALLMYFKRKYVWMAVFGGLAVSVKWTGLTFLALPLILESIYFYTDRDWRTLIPKMTAFLFIPAAIYFSVFAIHFSLLNKSGAGDAFMSLEFQKTLAGSAYEKNGEIKKSNLFQKFTELNEEMYTSNARLTATHPYGSKWYTWPFMSRPIFYWVNGDQRIYFLGNPVIWWSTTAALMYALISMIWSAGQSRKILIILLGGVGLNLLPFIGIPRVMFLYHYLSAFIFAILILAYLIDQSQHKKLIAPVLIFASAVSFIYFSPLSYGLNLSPREYNARVWLPSWR